MIRWRLLRHGAAVGALNMAWDEALMARARDTGEGVLRFYLWASPTLSLGRHQPARDRYDRKRAAAAGVSVVRRPTGGRAVLHHHELTYSVTYPERALGSPRESYRWINRLLLAGLSRVGVGAVEAAARKSARQPDTTPCFAEPAPGELMVDGRKLVGSAQFREDGAILQHGSILIDDDQAMATMLLREPSPPESRPIALRELMGRSPDPEELADGIIDAWAGLTGTPVESLAPDAALQHRVELLSDRYENESWTWRR
jgi:lipoate-protein ligase A